MKPRLIGLIGHAQVGKSTIAKHLVLRHDYLQMKFSESLKSVTRAFLQNVGVHMILIDRMIEGDLKDVPSERLFGKTPRDVMYGIGTVVGRNMVHEDIWTKGTMEPVQHHLQFSTDRNRMPQCVIMDDVRRSNEAKAIVAAGGELWHVTRQSQPHPLNTMDSCAEALDGRARIKLRLKNDSDEAWLLDTVDKHILKGQF